MSDIRKPASDGSRRWFDVKAAAKDETHIAILGAIGSADDGADVGTLLDAIGKVKTSRIRVTMHTPGGDAFAGLAVADALRNHKAKVTVRVPALCASAGTIIASGGADKIVAAEGALFLVHLPWSIAWGNKNDLRHAADLLDKIEQAILDAYDRHAKVDRSRVLALLEAETWLSAAEAVALGFATEVEDSDTKAQALALDAGDFDRQGIQIPGRFAGRFTKAKPKARGISYADVYGHLNRER